MGGPHRTTVTRADPAEQQAEQPAGKMLKVTVTEKLSLDAYVLGRCTPLPLESCARATLGWLGGWAGSRAWVAALTDFNTGAPGSTGERGST